MADPLEIPAPPPGSAPRGAPASPFWPCLVWIAVQVGALLLAGLRVPLSARFPAPAESLAMHEMAVAQTLFSALLFPFLFRDRVAGAFVLASAPLFMQLASFVSAQGENWVTVAVAVHVGLWLVALWLCAAALRGGAARLYAVAVAVLLCAGGATLAYLHREFATAMAGQVDWPRVAWLGPTAGSLALLEAGPLLLGAWAFIGLALACGSVVLLLRRWAWRRVRARKGVIPMAPQG